MLLLKLTIQIGDQATNINLRKEMHRYKRERERERETYQWEEEKIVMSRKKNFIVDGGGSSWRQGVLRDRERERELWRV